MEQMSINSSYSQHTSPAASPVKQKRSKEGISPQEGNRSRKAVVEHMDRLRKMQLQKQLEDRQIKLTKYLQQKQDGVQKEVALRHSKSSQWFQKAKTKAKMSNFGCPQLFERDLNGTLRDKKEIQNIYFQKKKTIPRGCKQNHRKVDTCNPQLPAIGKENSSDSGKSGEINLMELGIFTVQRDIEAFLRKFRTTVEHEFRGGADMSNIFDLNRMEYHLLHEINLDKCSSPAAK